MGMGVYIPKLAILPLRRWVQLSAGQSTLRVDLGGGVVGWGSVVFLERDFHSSVSVTNVNELPASLPGTDQTIS